MSGLYALIPSDRPCTITDLAELYAPMARYWAYRMYQDDRAMHRSLVDLEQDAWVGILEAWHSWDPGKGSTFKTYANNRARWSILNGQRQIDLGLARAYMYDRRLYSNILAMASLDDQDAAVLDTLPDPGSESGFVEGVAWESFVAMLNLVSDPRTRLVLMRRFGQDIQLEEIGNELGVSSERARQLVAKGCREIRAKLGGQ